jgi:hypothetical protein
MSNPRFDPNYRQLTRKDVLHASNGIALRRDGLSPLVSNANGPQSVSASPQSTDRGAPVAAGFGQFSRPRSFPPLGPMPAPGGPETSAHEFWRRLEEFWRFISPRVGASGGGGADFNRCLRAASGSTKDWEEFCGSIPPDLMSKTVGGETATRACWSKTFESGQHKTGWCKKQYGNFSPPD